MCASGKDLSGKKAADGLWALGSGLWARARARAVGWNVSMFKWLTKLESIFQALQDWHTFAPLRPQFSYIFAFFSHFFSDYFRLLQFCAENRLNRVFFAEFSTEFSRNCGK